MVFKGFFFLGKTGAFQLCELLVMLLWTPKGGDSYQEKIWGVTDHRSQQLRYLIQVNSRPFRGLLGFLQVLLLLLPGAELSPQELLGRFHRSLSPCCVGYPQAAEQIPEGSAPSSAPRP